MKILVINCGSSSLKYQLINMENEAVMARGLCEKIGDDSHMICKAGDKKIEFDISLPDHTAAFHEVKRALIEGECKVIDSLDEISAVGHRIVQGGALHDKSCLVTPQVERDIETLCELAPLHNAAHLQGIKACTREFGEKLPQIVVFDNAFHSSMPPKAYIFPLPYEFYEKYKVRRYGFHGTSHKYVCRRLAEIKNISLEGKNIIVCHLGNGSSLSAVKDGKVIDTSMGLTPLDGFIMGTRCGAVDPSAITYIQAHEGLTPSETDILMNKKSGFLGVSGVSSDLRSVEIAADKGNERAKLTLQILYYQIAKLIGAYTVAMGGLDALCFTAGIGENSPRTRRGICDYLSFAGIEIDEEANKVQGEEKRISTDSSSVNVYVIPTNEELMIARETMEVVLNLKAD